MLSTNAREICELFARVLEYPGRSLVPSSVDCAQLLGDSFPSSAELMRSFAAFAERQSQEAMEELYIQTFDITPVTTLYFGYHLFGDTPRRSAFLVRLDEAYQACGFSGGKELPDHVCAMLRYLSIGKDAEFILPLLEECLLPVSERIEQALKKDRNAYSLVLGSMRLFLEQASRKLVKAGGSRS